VLVGHAIKYAFDNGLGCFDFMRGEEAYKFRWTDQTRQMFAVRLGVSLRGRVGLAVQGQGAQVKGLLKRVAAARVAAPTPAPAAEADAS
jgi:CelD/BcsL family acetyltransferase involved in cellulose biosynthesis